MTSLEEITKQFLSGKEKCISSEALERAAKRIPALKTHKELDSCHENLRNLWAKISESSVEKSSTIELIVIWNTIFLGGVSSFVSKFSEGNKEAICKTILYTTTNIHRIAGLDALLIVAEKVCLFIGSVAFGSFSVEYRNKITTQIVQVVAIAFGRVRRGCDEKATVMDEVMLLLRCANSTFNREFFIGLSNEHSETQFHRILIGYCEAALQATSKLDKVDTQSAQSIDEIWKTIFGLLEFFTSVNFKTVLESGRKTVLSVKSKMPALMKPLICSVNKFLGTTMSSSRHPDEIAQVALWIVEVSPMCLPTIENLLKSSSLASQEFFVLSIRILLHFSGLVEENTTSVQPELVRSTLNALMKASEEFFELGTKIISSLVGCGLKTMEGTSITDLATDLFLDAAAATTARFPTPDQKEQKDNVLTRLYMSVLVQVKETVLGGGSSLGAVKFIVSVLSPSIAEKQSLNLTGHLGSCLTPIIMSDKSIMTTEDFSVLDDILHAMLLDRIEATSSNNDSSLAMFLAYQYSGIGIHDKSLCWLMMLSNKRITKDIKTKVVDLYCAELVKAILQCLKADKFSSSKLASFEQYLSVLKESQISPRVWIRLESKVFQFTDFSSISTENMISFLSFFDMLRSKLPNQGSSYHIAIITRIFVHLFLKHRTASTNDIVLRYLSSLADEMSTSRTIFDEKYTKLSKMTKDCDCDSQTSVDLKKIDVTVESMIGYLHIWIASAESRLSSIRFGSNYEDQNPSQVLHCLDKAMYSLRLILSCMKRMRQESKAENNDCPETFESIENSVRGMYYIYGCFGFIGDQGKVLQYLLDFEAAGISGLNGVLLEIQADEYISKLFCGVDIFDGKPNRFSLQINDVYRPIFDLIFIANELFVELRIAHNDMRQLSLGYSLEDFESVANSAFQSCKILKNSTMGSTVAALAANVFSSIWLNYPVSILWSKKSLTVLGRYYIGLNDPQNLSIRSEALLLIIDALEQIGCVDQSTGYIAEVVALAEKSTPALCANINLSLVRIWHRFSSPKLTTALSTLETLPTRRNDLLTARAVSCVKALKSLSSQEKVDPEDLLALRYRHLDMYWDIDTETIGGKLTFNSNLPRATKRYLHECCASDGLASSHLFPYSFDVIRYLRRRLVFEMSRAYVSTISNFGYSSSESVFVLSTSSCFVSIETGSNVKLDEKIGESCDHSVNVINMACQNDHSALVAVKDTLQKTVFSRIGDSCEGAICAVVFEPISSTMIISRRDLVGTYSVTIPGGERLEKLLQNWSKIMTTNSVQLKATSSEDVSKWTSKEKRTWWDERQKLDTDLNIFLSDLEALLGPWRSMFLNFKIKCVRASEEFHYESIEPNIFEALETLSTSVGEKAFCKKSFVLLLLHAYSKGINSRQETVDGIKDIISVSAGISAAQTEFVEHILELHEKNCVASASSHNQEDSFDLRSLSISLNACAFYSDEPEEVNYDDWKVTDLRSKLKSFELSSVGKKNELVDRLKDYDAKQKENLKPVCALVQRQRAVDKKSTSGASDVVDKKSTSSVQQQQINLRQSLLMFDETLQDIPWESIPCLRKQACSRIPSLLYLLKKFSSPTATVEQTCATQSSKGKGKATSHQSIDVSSSTSKSLTVSARKCWYAVDPEGNLPGTRVTMMEFLNPLARQWSWQGFAGEMPPETTMKVYHTNSDLFIYCGHGAGEVMCDNHRLKKLECPASFLWGCSSGRMTTLGIHDPFGPALTYLTNGSPWVVGNLWDVTDKDIDRLSIRCMTNVLSRPDILLDDQNIADDMQGSVVRSLPDARGTCKLKDIVGSAPVIYGLPTAIEFD